MLGFGATYIRDLMVCIVGGHIVMPFSVRFLVRPPGLKSPWAEDQLVADLLQIALAAREEPSRTYILNCRLNRWNKKTLKCDMSSSDIVHSNHLCMSGLHLEEQFERAIENYIPHYSTLLLQTPKYFRIISSKTWWRYKLERLYTLIYRCILKALYWIYVVYHE